MKFLEGFVIIKLSSCIFTEFLNVSFVNPV